MKIKTSELEGAALDWAVAKSVDRPVSILPNGVLVRGANASGGCKFSPSTDWSQGGPLLEHLMEAYTDLSIFRRDSEYFVSEDDGIHGGSMCSFIEKGTSLLIAACRAIVAAKLGDTVDVPDELL